MIPASPADTLGFCTDVPPGGTQGPGGNFHRDAGSPDYVASCMAGPPVSGKLTSFPQAVKLKPGEVVRF